jgi:hypothetical protein
MFILSALKLLTLLHRVATPLAFLGPLPRYAPANKEAPQYAIVSNLLLLCPS